MNAEMTSQQARENFSELVDAARVGKTTTYITRYGRRVAAVVPVPESALNPTIRAFALYNAGTSSIEVTELRWRGDATAVDVADIRHGKRIPRVRPLRVDDADDTIAGLLRHGYTELDVGDPDPAGGWWTLQIMMHDHDQDSGVIVPPHDWSDEDLDRDPADHRLTGVRIPASKDDEQWARGADAVLDAAGFVRVGGYVNDGTVVTAQVLPTKDVIRA